MKGLVGASLMGFLVLAACGAGPPDIALSTEAVDLGVIPNGEIREVMVQVENRGGQPLAIRSVTTSCGCTTAEVDRELVEPGGAATLTIRYDSGAHGPEFEGPVVRQVFVASNDPDAPEVEVRLAARVVVENP